MYLVRGTGPSPTCCLLYFSNKTGVQLLGLGTRGNRRVEAEQEEFIVSGGRMPIIPSLEFSLVRALPYVYGLMSYHREERERRSQSGIL